MPYQPQVIEGKLGTLNVNELSELGILTKGVSFSLDQAVMDTRQHIAPNALNQIVRSRTDVYALLIDFDAEAIPDQNGNAFGLAAVYCGQNVATCAHFAATVQAPDGSNVDVQSQVIFGMQRDSNMYLQVQEPTLDLSPSDPAAVKFKLRYLPYIKATAASN